MTRDDLSFSRNPFITDVGLERFCGQDSRCFLVVQVVSTPVLQTHMTDRSQICPCGRASTVTDVLARFCKWQTPFSGRDDASKPIVNKFRKPAILQLNIEGLTASKMSVLYHLAAQHEALVIFIRSTFHNLQELHQRLGDTLLIWRMEDVGKNFGHRHDYTFCISQDLGAKLSHAKTVTAASHLHN